MARELLEELAAAVTVCFTSETWRVEGSIIRSFANSARKASVLTQRAQSRGYVLTFSNAPGCWNQVSTRWCPKFNNVLRHTENAPTHSEQRHLTRTGCRTKFLGEGSEKPWFGVGNDILFPLLWWGIDRRHGRYNTSI